MTSQVVYRTLGASQGDPGPMLAFFSICVIVTTFFWTIAFGGWPFTAMFRNPVAAGLATWLGCYAVGVAIYWTFCDFTYLQGAPVYVPSADPHGLFTGVERGRLLHVGADDPLRVALLRPVAADSTPALMKQPTLGVVLTGTSLLVGLRALLRSASTG